jgi:hypothetical protein
MIRIVVGLPAGEDGILFVELKQGSGPGLITGAVVEVACNVGTVGSDMGVSVGSNSVGGEVGLAVSVGGKGVSVGAAVCVSATNVTAIAAAVNCRSAGSIVGATSPAHPLMIKVIATTTEKILMRFIVLSIFLLELTIGEATPLSDDTFVLYNNGPAALCDAEPTEYPEILLAIYKGGSAILSNGPAKTTIGFELLTEISAFSQFCYYIQRERNQPFRLGFICQIQLCRWTIPGGESFIARIRR